MHESRHVNVNRCRNPLERKKKEEARWHTNMQNYINLWLDYTMAMWHTNMQNTYTCDLIILADIVGRPEKKRGRGKKSFPCNRQDTWNAQGKWHQQIYGRHVMCVCVFVGSEMFHVVVWAHAKDTEMVWEQTKYIHTYIYIYIYMLRMNHKGPRRTIAADDVFWYTYLHAQNACNKSTMGLTHCCLSVKSIEFSCWLVRRRSGLPSVCVITSHAEYL